MVHGAIQGGHVARYHGLRRVVGTCGLLAMLFGSMASACGNDTSRTDDRSRPSDSEGSASGNVTVSEAVDFAGIDLPDSATDVSAYGERGIDQLVLVSFTMPADQLDDFISASDLPTPQPGRNPLQPSFAELADWPLDTLEDFEGASELQPARQYVVDTSDRDTVVVYLAAFNT